MGVNEVKSGGFYLLIIIMPDNPKISLIAPIYNEAENLERFIGELIPVLESIDPSFEIVAVDDGSTDRSFETLVRLRESDDRIKIIRFRGNSEAIFT